MSNSRVGSAGGDGSANARRAATAGAVGTVVEWYDYGLYGTAAALVINPLFFPNVGPAIGTLAAFATFAVGFFARPLGGIVLGHFGDRVGRKPVFVATVMMMGVSTVLIGLLPTYGSIGIWAPVLLVFLRLLQGFGAGAELAGAFTYVAEYSPDNKRAFFTSLSSTATAVGLVLSTGIFALMTFLLTEDQLLAWGWRIPFLASVLIFLVALYIRSSLQDSPEFQRQQAHQEAHGRQVQKLPVSRLLRESRRNLLGGFLSVSGLNATSYVTSVFALSFMTATLGLPYRTAIISLLVMAVVTTVTCPLFGMLADRIGSKPVFTGGAVFAAIFAFPFFWLLQTENLGAIAFAMIASYAVGWGAMAGAQGAFLTELFDTKHRYTGVAVSRELNGVLIAGPTPFIAAILLSLGGGSPWLVALFVIATQILTIIGVWGGKLRRVRGDDVGDVEDSVVDPEDPVERDVPFESGGKM